MSFRDTAPTFEEAGKSRMVVSWKGEGMIFGPEEAFRSGGGDIGLSKLLIALSLLSAWPFSSFRRFRGLFPT